MRTASTLIADDAAATISSTTLSNQVYGRVRRADQKKKRNRVKSSVVLSFRLFPLGLFHYFSPSRRVKAQERGITAATVPGELRDATEETNLHSVGF